MNENETITKENCGEQIRLVRKVSGMTRAELAQILGCAESVITRLKTKKTMPSEDFLGLLKALSVIGYYRFSKISNTQKESVSEAIGAATGGVVGMAGSIAAVTASGVAGLSATGVATGLAALGMGSMVAGIGVVAAIPCAVGLAGYGLIKGIKSIAEANNLRINEIDDRFEIVTQPQESEKADIAIEANNS